LVWWPDLVYWMSNGSSKRRWLGGEGTFTDGSVLGYMVGQDVGVGDGVFHHFNLVLADHPVHDASEPTSNLPDVVLSGGISRDSLRLPPIGWVRRHSW
jgi:hypothetical protein